MAEDLNEQEPTAEEKAKFEADVLKAAEDAMNLDERRETRASRARSVILKSNATKDPVRMLPPSSPQTPPLNSLRNPLPKTRLPPSRQPLPMQTTGTSD